MLTGPTVNDIRSLGNAMPKSNRPGSAFSADAAAGKTDDKATPLAAANQPLQKIAPKQAQSKDGARQSSTQKKAIAAQSKDFKSTLQGKLDKPAANSEKQPSAVESSDAGDDQIDDGQSLDGSNNVIAMQIPVTAKAKPTESAIVSPEALSHRAAWQNFLHKMKDKLGISANDILKAFKSLNSDELKRPPEENIAKMVASLGLNDQQTILAHQFFKEIVMRTDPKTFSDDLQSPNAQSALVITSQNELRKEATDQSLAQMNQKFFAPTAQASAAQPEVGKNANPDSVTGKEKNQNKKIGQSPLLAAVPSAPTTEVAGAPPKGMPIPNEMVKADGSEAIPKGVKNLLPTKGAQPTLAKAANSAAKEAQAPIEATAHAAPSPALAALNAKLAKYIPAPTPSVASAANATAQASAPSAAPMMIAPKPIFSGSPDKDLDDGDDRNSDVSFDSDDAQIGSALPFNMNAHAPGEVAAAPKGVNAQPMQPMQVQELMQQAHFMVKDGGGEVKVILQPEGLGEVAMKVSVQDGKVNVQMITQTLEAKKALESSFNSLKDGLNAHHLSLETIKIDTAQNLGKQLDQQYQDAQKQSARQFLEQFHQNNQGWRQSFFDIPGAEVYRSQALSPVDAPAGVLRGQSMGGSRRLDLVA